MVVMVVYVVVYVVAMMVVFSDGDGRDGGCACRCGVSCVSMCGKFW